MCDKVKQLEALLAEAVGLLRKIADWPNGGSQYGQENIKNAAKLFLATQPAAPVAAGEPVAWIGPLGIKYLAEFESRRDNRTVCVYASKNAEDAVPLYTAPPAAADGDETQCQRHEF